MIVRNIMCISFLLLFVNCKAQDNMGIWTFHSTDLKSDTKPYQWQSKILENCPVEQSSIFSGVIFTEKFANYTKADTWYPTWAEDGNLYSPWTDGTIGAGMDFVWSGKAGESIRGHAKIEGDDPLSLKIKDYKIIAGSALPYQGRYPCGSLFYNGVWYYGSYTIDQTNKALQKDFGWYNMGPLVGFRHSTDYGKTWTKTEHTPANPLFPEVFRDEMDLEFGIGGKFVKFGAPHFVDFGKNMEHSPDGKAYLVGHGASRPDAKPRVSNNSWNSGDAIYASRVTPSIENMNDASKYEYFSGHDVDGKEIWTKDFKNIKPIFEWNNNVGIVTMTYNAPLKKYFMCITDGHRGTTSRKNYDTYILESNDVAGPWKMVTYMEDFGPQAYFVNIISKFTSEDGNTMWLCYSANYMYDKDRNNADFVKNTKPKGSAYSLSLHEFKLDRK
ncbi:hypothetical protein [Zobellia roscoffensis]|uniref:hypothetical protein n=1 Tax=Zobellia roscoffensis TaxID=2779508 RepID=UPI00188C3F81|nr:hypothetical protein [Zobellia roscoffensis]